MGKPKGQKVGFEQLSLGGGDVNERPATLRKIGIHQGIVGER